MGLPKGYRWKISKCWFGMDVKLQRRTSLFFWSTVDEGISVTVDPKDVKIDLEDTKALIWDRYQHGEEKQNR